MFLLSYQLQFGYGRKSGPPKPILLVTVVKEAGEPGPYTLVIVMNSLPSANILFINRMFAIKNYVYFFNFTTLVTLYVVLIISN